MDALQYVTSQYSNPYVILAGMMKLPTFSAKNTDTHNMVRCFSVYYNAQLLLLLLSGVISSRGNTLYSSLIEATKSVYVTSCEGKSQFADCQLGTTKNCPRSIAGAVCQPGRYAGQHA